MNTHRIRRALWGFSLLTVAILGSPAPAGSPQDTQRPDDETHRRLREANRQALAGLAKDLEKPEWRPHDLGAWVERVGRDPARLVASVQKEIRFEPYPGLQRGPAGTLVAGSGNALDKSFLLMELLRAIGCEARMVKGTLSPEKAGDLVKAAIAGINSRPAGRFRGPFGGGEVRKEQADSMARRTGLSAEPLLRLLRMEEEERRAAWNGVLEITAREEEFLRSQLRAAAVGAQERAVGAEIVAAAQAHAWVQWKTKDGPKWTDSDPCFPDLPAGGTAAAAEGEIDPAQVADRLTIALVLDRKTGDKREAVEVLKYEVPVHETLLRPVRFMINPTDGRLPAPDAPREDLIKQLTGYREFVAAVVSGGEAPASMIFDYDGAVSKPKVAAGRIGKGAAGTAQGAADLFNPQGAAKSTTEGLRVDLGIVRGGKPLWTQRRTILEEGRRAAWCPILNWTFFVQSHEISNEFIRAARINHRIRNEALTRELNDAIASGSKADLLKASQKKGYSYPLDLLEFCRARQGYIEGRTGGPAWLFFPAPNVFISGQQARIKEGGAGVCLCRGMDLVDNGAIVFGTKGGGSVDREGTAALGTFDTVLEQAFLQEANPREGTAGAVSWFERARVLSRPIRTVAAGDGKALGEAGVPPADAEWITRHAAPGGRVLVAPSEGGHCAATFAWWSYEPDTGRTVGRISGGRGGCEAALVVPQTMAEFTEALELSNLIVCLIQALLAYAEQGGHAGDKQLRNCAWGAAVGLFIGGGLHLHAPQLAWECYEATKHGKEH